ncbi:Ig-like domain-containing protein, partial [Marinobacter salarius]
ESSNPANDGSGPFDISNRDDAATVDADNDGLVDDTADQDGDGIADAVDQNASGFGAQVLPTVETLITNDSTPTLNGTLQSFSGSQFDVTVNGQTYVDSNPALVIDGNAWALTIPAGAALADGQYDVTATIRDAQDQAASDTTSGELIVDLQAPTVTLDALANADGNNTTAYTLSGQCTEIADMIGILISDQDGRSVSDSTLQCQDDGNGNGRFSSTLDLSNLQDGSLDVQVIAMDLAGNETETDGSFIKNACQPDANSSLCDVDRDGVPDGYEADNGLSTTSNDSDGDGIPDAEEFGGDLSNPRDSDGDGVIDALDTD